MLKTPISTVKAVLEALSKYDSKSDPELIQEYLNMALLEANLLDNLINKVLDHSKLEENTEILTLLNTHFINNA